MKERKTTEDKQKENEKEEGKKRKKEKMKIVQKEIEDWIKIIWGAFMIQFADL